MEKEKQNNCLTNNKYQQKQHINSFYIFEPDYFINSAFTLTDSQQKNTSKLLEQPFNLTPIRPSSVLVEQSKEKLRGKPNGFIDSTIEIKKTATPSIENIVLEYQKNQNQTNLLEGLLVNKISDIFSNKPQFSSIEIKNSHLAKEKSHVRKPSSLQSKFFQEEFCESKEYPDEKVSSTSIKFNQKKKAFTTDLRFPESKLLFKQIDENKKMNSKLERINEFLKIYTKNKRQTYFTKHQKQVNWSILRTIIQKELKYCANT